MADAGGWQTPSETECLKMSYYTGPHEEALIPLRLMVAARLDPSADAVLRKPSI